MEKTLQEYANGLFYKSRKKETPIDEHFLQQDIYLLIEQTIPSIGKERGVALMNYIKEDFKTVLREWVINEYKEQMKKDESFRLQLEDFAKHFNMTIEFSRELILPLVKIGQFRVTAEVDNWLADEIKQVEFLSLYSDFSSKIDYRETLNEIAEIVDNIADYEDIIIEDEDVENTKKITIRIFGKSSEFDVLDPWGALSQLTMKEVQNMMKLTDEEMIIFVIKILLNEKFIGLLTRRAVSPPDLRYNLSIHYVIFKVERPHLREILPKTEIAVLQDIAEHLQEYTYYPEIMHSIYNIIFVYLSSSILIPFNPMGVWINGIGIVGIENDRITNLDLSSFGIIQDNEAQYNILQMNFDIPREIELITSIPESIGKLTHLKSLHLNNNALTSIPETISNLEHLEVLDISNNQLTSLPSLKKLQSLEFLDITSNNFPEEILTIFKDSKLEEDIEQRRKDQVKTITKKRPYKMKCEECNGDLIQNDTVYICKNCGLLQ